MHLYSGLQNAVPPAVRFSDAVRMISLVKSFVAFSLFCLCQCNTFPPYLTPCKRNEPDLHACILEKVESLRPHLAAGIPELGIPALNPLVIPKIELNNGNFHLVFLDNSLHHLDEFVVDVMDFNIDKDTLALKLTFPRMMMDSKYEVKGRILVLDLDGTGPSQSNYTNVKVTADFELDRITKKDKEYWRVKKSDINANFGRPVIYFENLFGDNKELNDHTMKLVNENIDQFVGDLQPAINEAVGGITLGLIERLIHKFSTDELFP